MNVLIIMHSQIDFHIHEIPFYQTFPPRMMTYSSLNIARTEARLKLLGNVCYYLKINTVMRSCANVPPTENSTEISMQLGFAA